MGSLWRPVLVALLVAAGWASAAPCGQNGEPTVCSTPTTFQDRRADKSKLTIAAYNAEWLFWDNGNGGPSTKCPLDHSSGTCPWKDAAELEAHLQIVASELSQVDADIVALEEVQDCVVLQCLINAIGDSSYKPYLIPGRDTATNQNVGIISRVDPVAALFRDESRAVIQTADSPCGNLPNPSYESGVSKHFIARFDIPNLGPITLIGLHLLAFPVDPDRCIKREAQATVVKGIYEKEVAAGRNVIVLGDLNDYDSDVLDASNSIPTSRVSRILKYDDGGIKEMFAAAEYVNPQAERYSSWWDKDNDCIVEPGELTMIDHVFISSKLQPLVTNVEIFNTVQSCESLQSDHYPIKVTFNTAG